ncbi:MAG: RNA methyltransferase [Phyllobacteriaceae bacterium]|nr:RNA methyltransferase [Phyllobacteriaceae bacterium]
MSGTDFKNKPLIAEGPAVILCEPQLGQNIGMVARAMANFGLAELRLVAPRDGWPNEHATKAASGALHVVENASVHATLEEAVADLSFVMATTARPRDIVKPVRGPEEAAGDLRRRFLAGEKTGILYGRERWGLNNDEIILADEIVTFPVNPAFASLNIAQAVLLMSYEWMKTADSNPAFDAFGSGERVIADRKHLVGLMEHVEQALDDAGYFFPAERRDRMAQTVRNIFVHMKLQEQEIQTLRGVVAALEGRRRKQQN